MKNEIIYTEQYALIVSDEEIKEGDYYINIEEKNGVKNPFYNKIYIANQSLSRIDSVYKQKWLKKVIAHQPLTDAPILEGVPLLPEFSKEEDVKKLSLEIGLSKKVKHQNHQKRNKMNNERYNQIIDETYKNYEKEYEKGSHLEGTGLLWMAKESKETFIYRTKTDKEFSERWRLKIEERDLSLEERLNLVSTIIGEEKIRTHEDNLARVDKLNIPTKLITVTYKDEIIEIVKGGNK